MSVSNNYPFPIKCFVTAVARRFVTAATICWAALACGAAVSQESGLAETEQPVAATSADEEIVVRGRSRAFYRTQIELAEEAVFDRFNEINSDDDYDIHCRTYRVLGSKIPQRICQPNFWREEDANIGEETARGMQGGLGFNPGMFRGMQHYKRGLMSEEIRQLALEDEAFREALVRLVNLQQNYESDRQSRRRRRGSD